MVAIPHKEAIHKIIWLQLNILFKRTGILSQLINIDGRQFFPQNFNGTGYQFFSQLILR